jgi:hypothetical protein
MGMEVGEVHQERKIGGHHGFPRKYAFPHHTV